MAVLGVFDARPPCTRCVAPVLITGMGELAGAAAGAAVRLPAAAVAIVGVAIWIAPLASGLVVGVLGPFLATSFSLL